MESRLSVPGTASVTRLKRTVLNSTLIRSSMIILGVILLLSAIGLIWFRTPLTGTRIGDGDIPFSIYIVNQSGQTTLLWIAGLIDLLGIGLIIAGVIRPKTNASGLPPTTDAPDDGVLPSDD